MLDEETPEQPPVEQPRKRTAVVLVITALFAGAAVAGTMLGPSFVSRMFAPSANRGSALHDAGQSGDLGAEHGEAEPLNPQAFAPIVVDVRNKRGEMHHMRIGITVELGEKVSKDEFERYQPRGREAAIAFLRSKTYEELTESTAFESVTKELNQRITLAMGERRCHRVVISDYVAQ
jgi:flagellar basal body-associated protein FliL